MCCVSSDRVWQFWPPKLYFKSTSQSQKERERDLPLPLAAAWWFGWRAQNSAMWWMQVDRARVGRGLKHREASWSSKPPVFLRDYLGPGEPSRWARSITVFVVATTLRPAQSKITFNCNAKDIHSWNNETNTMNVWVNIKFIKETPSLFL